MLRVQRIGSVVVWTIDRPEAKNALNHATLAALGEVIDEASRDQAVRAAVLTSAGDTFVSGGDLRELRDKSTREDAERFGDLGFDVCHAVTLLPFPVICAIPGAAIGGGAELALACDLRVADPRARIAFKQVRLGVTTAWGTAARLVAAVGASTAARLLYVAQEIGAAEAKQIGLVDDVAEDGRALTTSLAWAAEIARGSPRAVAGMKRLVRAASASDVRALERQLFIETWSAPDHSEAVEAYFARRAPRWNDR